MSGRTVGIPTSRSHTSAMTSLHRESQAARRATRGLLLRRLFRRRQSFSDSPLHSTPSDVDIRNGELEYLEQEMNSLDLEYDRNGTPLHLDTDGTPSLHTTSAAEVADYSTSLINVMGRDFEEELIGTTPQDSFDNSAYRYDMDDIVEIREDGQHYLVSVANGAAGGGGFRGRASTPRYITGWDTVPQLFPQGYSQGLNASIYARLPPSNMLTYSHTNPTNYTSRNSRRIAPRPVDPNAQPRAVGGLATWSSEYAEKHDIEHSDGYVSETSEGEVESFRHRHYTPDR